MQKGKQQGQALLCAGIDHSSKQVADDSKRAACLSSSHFETSGARCPSSGGRKLCRRVLHGLRVETRDAPPLPKLCRGAESRAGLNEKLKALDGAAAHDAGVEGTQAREQPTCKEAEVKDEQGQSERSSKSKGKAKDQRPSSKTSEGSPSEARPRSLGKARPSWRPKELRCTLKLSMTSDVVLAPAIEDRGPSLAKHYKKAKGVKVANGDDGEQAMYKTTEDIYVSKPMPLRCGRRRFQAHPRRSLFRSPSPHNGPTLTP